ncbi:MAG: PadR family transcriptional regulator [Candidatus Binatus sp.]|uniref:PadR family transcriptional regulator n=1 Tax=Candidatus Binatus sp. TaxID=2811406 RepID=UPI00271A7C9E|nr:PadR family transcriptional regulator [Candidatus Binatus sp.]MDO8434505.1 PadR family transcriptional regulator [Candidatus Binatus sp.]
MKRATKKARVSRARKSIKRGARSGEIEKRGFTRPPPRKKTTLEHALLGLIAEMPGISGYDIMKVFDLSMTHYWHAHQGQIYPTLERMVQLGLIAKRDVIQTDRPNKRLYTITPAGERVLVGWLGSPFEGVALKHPPLLRCRFLGHLGADGAIEMLTEEREGWERYLKVYLELERDYFSGNKAHSNVNAMFSWFTLKRGIDWMKENIRWCDWAMDEIEGNRKLFPAVDMRAGLRPIVPFDLARHGEPRVSFAESQRRHAGDADEDDEPAARLAAERVDRGR